jgi:hypothetical protein
MDGVLTISSAPLADLCALLGIATGRLAAVEGGDVLSHAFPVDAADAARIDSSAVHAFAEQFGDAASVEVRTGDLTEVILGPATTDAEIAAFTARAVAGGPYEAVVTVDKARLGRRLAGDRARRSVRLFLFGEALRRALSRGITRFETEIWPDAPEPLVIAVLDTDCRLVGPHLAIIGGTSLPVVADVASKGAPTLDFDALIAGRERHVGWDTRWARALTPWYFELTGDCADPHLAGLLRAQLVKLAVLFTCDRARAHPGTVPPAEIRAEYRGREHVAVVPIDERNEVDADNAQTAAVLRAVDWSYRRHGGGEPDWVSDRLPFVQTRLAQALEPHPETDRLATLVRSMPYLLEGIEWHWKAFIEGKVSEYLTQVQQVESVAAETATTFADRTSALVKALAETILAAVAVLIGSFIAAAFKEPFNATLFRIGVRTYAVYVLLFPGALGLLVAHHSLRAARTGFDSRISRFKEILYTDKVDEIVGERVTNAQRAFYRWLFAVAALYVLIAAAAWVSGNAVPDRLNRDTATTPALSPVVPTISTVGPLTFVDQPDETHAASPAARPGSTRLLQLQKAPQANRV